MTPLAAALRSIGEALRRAADPWWIIDSAAICLHGIDTSVADVDVLVSERDARMVCQRWGRDPGVPAGDDRFRSRIFERFETESLPIEVMGALALRETPIVLRTRLPITVAGVTVYIPERDELVTLLRLFGREKDEARAALLVNPTGKVMGA